MRGFAAMVEPEILDVGGGAGVYALPLAADGYEVHLIDAIPLLVEQAAGVARPGGVVAAMALSRFYPMFEKLVTGLAGPPGDTARYLSDGQYRNPTGDVAAFTTSYFHRPEELVGEVEDAGLVLDQIAGANGIVKLLLPDLAQRLDDAPRRDQVLSLLRRLETEPSLLGASQNLVAIARAPW